MDPRVPWPRVAEDLLDLQKAACPMVELLPVPLDLDPMDPRVPWPRVAEDLLDLQKAACQDLLGIPLVVPYLGNPRLALPASLRPLLPCSGPSLRLPSSSGVAPPPPG